MRAPALAAIVCCGSVLALACGHLLTEDAPAPANDAGADTAAPEETPLTDFRCGEQASCVVGKQVCCPVAGGGGTCGNLEDGCVFGSAIDGGPDANPDGGTTAASEPSIRCTTYRNCGSYQECCYAPDAGSSCKMYCAQNEARLCEFGDNCRDYQQKCDALNGFPISGVGHCVATYSSGSSSYGGSTSGHF